MKIKTNRNFLLDNLKVILIFFVVFGHVIEYYIDESNILKAMYIFIYIFHMPLFVFISGYFSKNIKKVGKGAIKSLLIPYIIFNMIWYSAVYFATGEIMFSILYPGWTLWYLLSLFFWRSCLKYLIKIKYILPLSFVAGVLVGILPIEESVLSISRTISFLPFFLIGYYFNENSLKKIKYRSKLISIFSVISFFVIALLILKNNLLNYKFLYFSQSYMDSGLSIMQSVVIKLLLYIASMIFSISIINLTPKKETFYTYLGRSTMNIYIFHIYFVILIYIFIPDWNTSIFKNILILCSPILIIYILANKKVDIIYNGILYPVNSSLSQSKSTFHKLISNK